MRYISQYLRELYRADADVCIVSLCDAQHAPTLARYALLRAYLQTRACENIAGAYPTAPTAAFDANDYIFKEQTGEGILALDFAPRSSDVGAKGKIFYSDALPRQDNTVTHDL